MKKKVDYAADLIRQFPKVPSRTLARKLYEEHPLTFSSVEAARTQIRVARGAKGTRSRAEMKSRGVERELQKAGWKPECPPSLAVPWEPVIIDDPTRTLVISDIHVPFHDVRAVETAIAYGQRFKPTTIVINGDCIDFFTVSRYEKNPELRDLKRELDLTKQLLVWVRHLFKKADIIYKIGNHDFRFDKFIWNRAPELWDLDAVQLHHLLEFARLRIKRVDDNPIMCGQLPILHGHELRRGISNPVNPARGAFLQTLHSVLIGHLHQPSAHADSNLFHKEIMTWSTGCLCELTPAYARINRWSHGFATVDVSRDGLFNVSNLRIGRDYQVRSS